MVTLNALESVVSCESFLRTLVLMEYVVLGLNPLIVNAPLVANGLPYSIQVEPPSIEYHKKSIVALDDQLILISVSVLADTD